MRSVTTALLLVAACGYSEGGTAVNIRALARASTPCAKIAIESVTLEPSALGLRTAHGAEHHASSPLTAECDVQLEWGGGAVWLAALYPPPGEYARLHVKAEVDGSGSRSRAFEPVPRLDEDTTLELALELDGCPTSSGALDAARATWTLGDPR